MHAKKEDICKASSPMACTNPLLMLTCWIAYWDLWNSNKKLISKVLYSSLQRLVRKVITFKLWTSFLEEKTYRSVSFSPINTRSVNTALLYLLILFEQAEQEDRRCEAGGKSKSSGSNRWFTISKNLRMEFYRCWKANRPMLLSVLEDKKTESESEQQHSGPSPW